MTLPKNTKNLIALAGFLAITFLVSWLGALTTFESVGTWFQTLERPPLSPPDWVFGPVWTTLYGLMAIAAWLVWKRGGFQKARKALTLYGIQLFFNLGWSVLFFGLQKPGASLIEILCLWGLILLTLISFYRISRLAGWLLVPYLLWVSFATYLNAGFWWLN